MHEPKIASNEKIDFGKILRIILKRGHANGRKGRAAKQRARNRVRSVMERASRKANR